MTGAEWSELLRLLRLSADDGTLDQHARFALPTAHGMLYVQLSRVDDGHTFPALGPDGRIGPSSEQDALGA